MTNRSRTFSIQATLLILTLVINSSAFNQILQHHGIPRDRTLSHHRNVFQSRIVLFENEKLDEVAKPNSEFLSPERIADIEDLEPSEWMIMKEVRTLSSGYCKTI